MSSTHRQKIHNKIVQWPNSTTVSAVLSPINNLRNQPFLKTAGGGDNPYLNREYSPKSPGISDKKIGKLINTFSINSDEKFTPKNTHDLIFLGCANVSRNDE